MKITLNDNVCKEKGIKLDEILLILLVNRKGNIDEAVKEALEKEIIVHNPSSEGNYLITQRWWDLCMSTILSADDDVPGDTRLDKLVDKLMAIYPKGKKEGTTTYWRGNRKDVKLKLQKFFKLYGNKYTDDQIINATKKYVESFNGNYSYMRILIYFIWKATKKIDAEGKGYIEETSDLASYIENEGQENNNNWMNELR